MKLTDLCEIFVTQNFPKINEKIRPEREAVLTARAKLTDAVTDDEFLADCISWELKRLVGNRSYWGLAPFFEIPDLGICFAFGYWPPGGTPGPHEHTAWTITSLCRNKLDVLTYNYEESYRQKKLVPKNRFQAAAGQVGFIYEPCIHKPINLSNRWSLSLHVTSPLDGGPLSCLTEALPGLTMNGKPSAEINHPYLQVTRSRHRQRFIYQLAQTLHTMKNPRVSELLEECFKIASTPTRILINKMIQKPIKDENSESVWILEKTHQDLKLYFSETDDKVALIAETPDGVVEEFAVTRYARETILFIAKHSAFEVRNLPGNLTEDEKIGFASLLEETGLFKRVMISAEG